MGTSFIFGGLIMINIFDLLDKDLALDEEYSKLFDLFENEYIYTDSIYSYNIVELFNKRISSWKYRGTSTSLDDVLRKIGLKEYTLPVFAHDDILKLIQLILNVKFFLESEGCSFKKSFLFDNIDFILNKLQLDTIVINSQVMIIQKNVDVIIAANNVDKDLRILFFEYLDFEIEKDIKKKRNILKDIANKMEPDREKYNKTNKKLTNDLFNLFNKLNIRHNNVEGGKSVKIVKEMSDEELLSWYDKVFELVVYLINQKKSNKILSEIRELIKEIDG